MKNNWLLIMALYLSALFTGFTENQELTDEREGEMATLVIISDGKVSFYSESMKSFLENFEGEIMTIDLSDKAWSSSRNVQETLYDIYPDIVYCIGTRAFLVAEKYLPEKKLVYSSTVNSQKTATEKNIYGIASRLNPAMELMTISHIFPDCKTLATIYTDHYHEQLMKEATQAAEKLGMELKLIKVDAVQGVTDQALKQLSNVDALWLMPDPGAFPHLDLLKKTLDFAEEKQVPVISYSKGMLSHPAVVLSVGVDTLTIGRQAAIIVQRLLQGKVMKNHLFYPAGTYLKLAPERAKKMGLEPSPDASVIVNEIISE